MTGARRRLKQHSAETDRLTGYSVASALVTQPIHFCQLSHQPQSRYPSAPSTLPIRPIRLSYLPLPPHTTVECSLVSSQCRLGAELHYLAPHAHLDRVYLGDK